MRINRADLRSVLLGCCAFFCVLASWSVLKPVRDQIGVANGAASLPWMFTATVVAVLISAPAFAGMASRLRRHRIVPFAYRMFSLGIVAAWLALRADVGGAGAALFVWAGVYNLLSVSLLWALLADVFAYHDAAHAFGLVAAGGTLGTLVGPLLVEGLLRWIAPADLLPLSAALLELAAACARNLHRGASSPPLGGTVASGLRALLRSNLLLGMSAHIMLLTGTATILYVAQARLVAGSSADPRQRTLLFARADLIANLATIVAQALVVRVAARRSGLRAALAVLPLLTAGGLAAIALVPSLVLIAGVQGLRKAAHLGLERPAREALLATLATEEKYRSKPFIDTAVYRGGDAVGAWVSQALAPAALLPVALVLCTLWLANSFVLARHGPAGTGGARGTLA